MYLSDVEGSCAHLRVPSSWSAGRALNIVNIVLNMSDLKRLLTLWAYITLHIHLPCCVYCSVV